MRNINRISIVLDLIENNFVEFIQDCGINKNITELLGLFSVRRKEIEDFWLKNPDLRLTQVFVNLGIIDNFPGFWYYKEEVDYVIEKGYCNFEDIHFWGVNYTKEGKRLPKTEHRLLRDLDIDHIKAIIVFMNKHNYPINEKYLQYFEKRIKEDEELTNEINNLLNGKV